MEEGTLKIMNRINCYQVEYHIDTIRQEYNIPCFDDCILWQHLNEDVAENRYANYFAEIF